MENKIKEADNLIRQGKSSLAVIVIKSALKEAPEYPYLHYLLGIARMKCLRFFLAKRAFEKANHLLPNNAENLRSLGWVKVMLGQLDEGRKDLREAISLDLVNSLAYMDLAMSYFHYFDFKEGKQWLERALSLAPEDQFLLDNAKIAKKLEKEFLKYSDKERQKMKREKSNQEFQKFLRISALQYYYAGKALAQDEAEEVREEARLNGSDASVLTSEQETEIASIRKLNKISQKKEIIKKREEIEGEFLRLLKKISSPFSVEHIKDIIYYEKDNDDLTKIISIFDRGGDVKELDQILEIVNDAWNYFPHKSLDGLCPMDKILEYKDRHKK
ncbi:hypothetical protein KJ665_00675 [Patescibacteria group bacterium]|nr:hypothetical protein [Patescibacteria group bacterium]